MILGIAMAALQPHAVCYAGDMRLIHTVVVSHSAIFVAYAVISITLIILMQGKVAPYKTIWYGFAAFIMACGISHLLHVVAIFEVAAFWPEAYELAFTGAISLIVAGILVWNYPELRMYFEMLESHKHQRAEKYQDIKTIQNLSETMQKNNNAQIDRAMAVHHRRSSPHVDPI